MLVYQEVPVMGRVVVTTHRKFLYAARDSQRPVNVYQHVAQVQTTSAPPVRYPRTDTHARRHFAREMERCPEQAVQNNVGGKCGVLYLRVILILLDNRHELVIQFFPPRNQFLVSYAVRQYILTELLERNVFAPRLFPPYLEGPFYIGNQKAGFHVHVRFPSYLLHVFGLSAQPFRRIQRLPVRVTSRAEYIVCLVHGLQLPTVSPLVICHIVYQEQSRLVFQRIFLI